MRADSARRGLTGGAGTAGRLLLALLACWMLFPFMQIGVLAEDAIPFIAAVRVQDEVVLSLQALPKRAMQR